MSNHIYEPPAVAERALRNKVCQSFRLSRRFLGFISLVFFLNLGMVLQTFIKLYLTEPDILEISFCTKNWENGPKKRFFEFIEKFGYYFLHNLFYIENFYYFLCSCTNPIFEKIFVSEIWANVLSQQMAGFFNPSYLQKKSVK